MVVNAPRYNPAPTVAVGEWPLSSPTRFLGRFAFQAYARTLVGSLTITWGRKDVWTQPEPATLSFTVFDATDYWATKIAAKEALNVGVTVHIKLPAGVTHADAPNGEYYLFRGWTTKVTATQTRAWTTAGWQDGFMVTITCTDRAGALGQIPYFNITLPAQNMVDRFIRLRNDAASLGIREFYFDDERKNAPVREQKYDDSTGLDVLGDMYKSMGDQWAYNPNRNTINRLPSHYDKDRAANAGIYRYGDDLVPIPKSLDDPSGRESAHDRAPYPAGFIDGTEVSSKTMLTAEQGGEIDQIIGKWNNRHDNGRQINTTLTLSTARPPYRTLTFDSHLTDGVDLDPTVWKLQHRVQSFSGPHHPAVRYETGRFGGFFSAHQAMFWLLPCERYTIAFISSSPWVAATKTVGPYVSPSGGTITYARGEWTIDMDLMVAAAWMPADAGNAWNAISKTTTWDASPRLTPGVSWFDVRYLYVF